MDKKNMGSFNKVNKTSKEEKPFTKEDFFTALDKAILTTKKPKSPDEGKKKTSE